MLYVLYTGKHKCESLHLYFDCIHLDTRSKPPKQHLAILDNERSSSLGLKKTAKVEVSNPDADEVLPDSDSEDESSRKKKKRNNNHNSSDTESEDDGRQSDDENSEKEDSDKDEDNDDENDDDTEALMAELNRIKQERAAEAARQEAERKAREEKIRVENILKGNPLLNPGTSSKSSESVEFKVKRRWDDDVVFKNCAKGDVSGNKKRDFINDTLRSEFHKKFMDRYIK